jgi:thymidylate synthase
MNEKKLIIKSPKDKIETLAKELETNPDTRELSVATWADSVINEVNKIREEDAVEALTDNILEKDNENE